MLAKDGRCKVDTIGPKKHVIRHSKWVNKHHSFEDPRHLVELLSERLGSHEYAGILCMDVSSQSLLFEYTQQEQPKGELLSTTKSEGAHLAADKIKFHQWCERFDIPSPRSLTTNNSQDILRLADEFSYPFVLKGSHGSGGRQVDVIQSQSHLRKAIEAEKHRKGWVIQEFIDGTVGTTTMVASDGKLHACFSVANLVRTRAGLGPSAISQLVNEPELVAIATKMVTHGGVTGLTGFDWMLTKNGEFKVIDPHFGRVPPTASIAHLYQVDLGKAYISSFQSAPSLSTNKTVKKHIVWIFPQAYNLLFDRRNWRDLCRYHPFRKEVVVFRCGKGEWRLFLVQCLQYFKGSSRVVLGKRNKEFRSAFKSPIR